MRLAYPQCPHITRKRGIYHYRRRLPGHAHGEVLLSLGTRHFRTAEHLAALVDRRFDETWSRLVSETDQTAQLGPILRKALRDALDDDVRRRVERPPGTAVYAYWWEPGDEKTAVEADLEVIRTTKADFDRAIAENRPADMMEEEADQLLRQHGLPASLKSALVHGLMEVARQRWVEAEQRSLGIAPITLQADKPETRHPPDQLTPSEPVCEAGPPEKALLTASALVEPFFERRERTDSTTHQVIGQERGTVRRFLEAAGDRPPGDYRRADVSAFLDLLRQLPNTYGRSPRDKDRSLAELIAEADRRGAVRLTDKTVKRHLSALSQFFQFAVDRGHLTVAARGELVEGHRFREDRAARDQRDAWTSAELVKLFTSPVWSGCVSACNFDPLRWGIGVQN